MATQSAAATVFQALCSGASFKQPRRREAPEPISVGEASANKAKARRKRKAALDFFGTQQARAPAPTESAVESKSKRTDAAAAADHEEDTRAPGLSTQLSTSKRKRPRDDGGLELFGGSGATADSTTGEGSKARSGASQLSVEEEEARAFRRRLGIRISSDGGGSCPHPVPEFDLMPFSDTGAGQRLKRALLTAVEESDWKEPTPVQMQGCPALCSGRDVVGSAPTGSGKTAAFVVPALIRLTQPVAGTGTTPSQTKKQKKAKKGGNGLAKAATERQGPRVVLLAPTRELAAQIHREVARLSAGTGLKTQLLSKARAHSAGAGAGGPVLLVSTPMRLLSAYRQGLVQLGAVELVVLDEADKLFEIEADERSTADEEEVPLEKSFLGQIDELLGACDHPSVQRALFSATMGPQVKELVDSVLREPLRIEVGLPNAGASTIEQRLVFVGREEGKLLAIRQLVQQGLRPPVLVFLQSKERAKELFKELAYDGINVDVIHAERTPQQRDLIIKRFRTGEIWVLICTELMARGVDFKGVNMVINFDLPQSAVAYIHRIGRTGRAGRRGLAVTLFTERDMPQIRPIANVVKLSGCEVPDWMLTIKRERRDVEKRRATGAPAKRASISTNPRRNKLRSFTKHKKTGGGGGPAPHQHKKRKASK